VALGLRTLVLIGAASIGSDGTIDYASQKGRTGAMLVRQDRLPLHTKGRFIVDAYGERVKWSCVNWYGAYSPGQWVVGGLEVQSMSEIVVRIIQMGFNCVRLPYSTQAYYQNPAINASFVGENTALAGASWQVAFDATVAELTKAGLMVIINNHISKDGWCCLFSNEEGLWYVPGWNESMWIGSLTGLAARYKDNQLVVAYDLRNEPHDFENTHLTWGDGNPETDLAAAMTRAGNAVLAATPDVLIVIEGLCFASDLRPVRDFPIILNVEHRVVYEVHNYLEFQDHTLFSLEVMSYDSLHRYGRNCAILQAMGLLFFGGFWYMLDCQRPPSGVRGVVLGSICVVLGSIASVGLKVVIDVFTRMKACAYGMEQDWVPGFRFLQGVISFGVILFLWGIWRMWPRIKRTYLDACSEDEAEESHGGPAASLQPNLGLFSAPGWHSFVVLQRRSLNCITGYFEQDATGGFGNGNAPPKARTLQATAEASDSSDEDEEEDDIAMEGTDNYMSQPCKAQPRPVIWDRGMCLIFLCCVFFSLTLSFSITVMLIANLEKSYWAMERQLDRKWGFILDQGHDYTAPVWMGEFGETVRGTYWDNLLKYFADRDVDWSYWPLNGRAYKDSERKVVHDDIVGLLTGRLSAWFEPMVPHWEAETYGILAEDYIKVQRPWQLLDLQGIMDSPAKWEDTFYPCHRDVMGPRCGG